MLAYAVGQAENQYQRSIRTAVQGVFAASMHPRTAVQVTIQVNVMTCMLLLYAVSRNHVLQSHDMQVVRDNGSVLPCALNATCAALVDAGILLRSMFGKCCVQCI